MIPKLCNLCPCARYFLKSFSVCDEFELYFASLNPELCLWWYPILGGGKSYVSLPSRTD